MKISNLRTVNQLAGMLEKIKNARVEIEAMEKDLLKSGHDTGGLPEYGMDMGFSCHLSTFKDRSGPHVNLSGLYLQGQMINATKTILDTRETEIKMILATDFGVVADGEDE